MTDASEIKELIKYVESSGGSVEILTGSESLYADGSPCYRVTSFSGFSGAGVMSPISFAERIRDIRAARTF